MFSTNPGLSRGGCSGLLLGKKKGRFQRAITLGSHLEQDHHEPVALLLSFLGTGHCLQKTLCLCLEGEFMAMGSHGRSISVPELARKSVQLIEKA